MINMKYMHTERKLTNVKATITIGSIDKHILHGMMYLIVLLGITIFHNECDPITEPFGNEVWYRMLKYPSKTKSLLVWDP